MEQKSKASKRTTTRKGASSNTTTPQQTNTTTATTLRYSLRNRKESTAATTSAAADKNQTTRSQKRKLESGQQAQTFIEKNKNKNKKPKMDHSTTTMTSGKGKQKAEPKTTTSKKMKQDDVLDDYDNDNHGDEVQADEDDDDDDDDELDPMHSDSQQEDEENASLHNHQQEEEDDEDDHDPEQHHQEEEEEEEEDDDNEDDDDDEENEMSRVRRTLGLHMQGLFGGMMSSDFGRFKSILASLKNNDDPTMQLIALQELAEILSVSSEDNLAGYFSSDSFARELVRIMKGPDDVLSHMGGGDDDMDQDMMLALAMSEGFSGGNPEVMLLACRCISNLLEAMPTAVTSIVSHGAIKVLCQKLKSIQYIDLAEQALYALEKIAAQLPRAVVHEGGLGAALLYFDFFSIHAQRTALRTASNCMRGIDIDSFPQVMEVVPTLMNTMRYSDRSVIELSCLCWVRIAESYRSNKTCLERAISSDLLQVLYGLLPIPGNTNAVHPATCQDVLRIFRSIAKASPQLGFELLKLDMIQGLCHLLTGSTATTTFTQPHQHHPITLDSKWRDAIPTIMKIIVDLLPPLPKDDMFSTRRFRSVASRTRSASSSAATTDTPTTTTTTMVDPRITWFDQHPDVMLQLDALLFPLVLDIYASTVNLRVRQLVTHTCVKLLQFSTADTLNQVLKDVSLSSFLSGILTRQEHPVLLMDALYQTELLIKKLPKVYPLLFEREGVLHEIESISKLPLEETVPQKPATADQAATSTQPSQENTTVDESDDTTTDADKQVSKEEEEEATHEEEDDEEQEEQETKSDANAKATHPGSSSSTTTTTAKPSQQQQQARMLDNHGLQAMMRNHQLLQHRHRHHAMENEKGVGRGSTRKYIIQLAQHLVETYFYQQQDSSRGSSLKEILQFTHAMLHPTDDDPTSEKALVRLSAYLRDSVMGISSFELINSGLMKALLAYLTSSNDDTFKTPLQDRVEAFERVFVQQPDIDTEGNNALKKLVVRLQEILSRFESFEVVTPLESTANDSLRNPTSMLAKQLRLRLSGTSDDIPSSFKQLMVSTHAVATFRVLEDYLLARISATSILCDMEEEEEEEEEEEQDDDEEGKERVIIDRDGMDIDSEEDLLDTVMTETVVVNREEEEEEENQQEPATSSKATNTTKKQHKDGEYKIRFSMNGTTISNDATVYAAIHQHEISTTDSTSAMGRNIWATSHPISFERVWVRHSEQDPKKDVASQLADIARPKELKEDSTCYQVLLLLKALSPAIAKRTNGITPQDFVNRKLTAKANRQLEEPLIVASACLPTWLYWLMSETPFLFPFETRYLFIQSTSFGYARLIARWQSLQMRNNTQNGPRNDTADQQQPVLGRMERQKVRIMRTQMLESAVKILDLFGSSPTVLEIEYMGEEGTGMGPTLEFYAATSKEFSKHSLNMWRGSHKTEKGHVEAPYGLFPKTCVKPTSRSAKKVNQLFKTLGQFIAKGLLDFRILDIPFNTAFFKVALDHVEPSPALLMEIDPQLAKSVRMLTSYVEQKRAIYQDISKTLAQKSAKVKDIQVDGAKLEDLCLDFTLPGDSSYELKAGGSDIAVTINNVEEYIDLLQDAIAGSGIAQQINAFREGFNGLFAIDDLKLLTHDELVSLFGKASEDWSYTTLANTIRADHGFTMESEPVRFLLEILSNFTDVEKRQFLQFTTGSPRLPIGGWKALRPVFTVVCKIPEAPLTPDDYLPSVMTCANYFKMPAYSTKEIMLERLLTSMKEGQSSFLLS